MEKKIYEVQIGSPPDYEELVGYIYLSNESISGRIKNYKRSHKPSIYYIESEEIAIITKEEGPDKVKIKFSEYTTQNELELDELMEAIKKAKEDY